MTAAPATLARREQIEQPRERLPYKWKVLIAVIFGVFMSTVDTTAVNVAFPTLRAMYGATLHEAQWIVSIYVMALGMATAAIDGAATVFLYLVLVLPPPASGHHVQLARYVNAAVYVVYLAVAVLGDRISQVVLFRHGGKRLVDGIIRGPKDELRELLVD